MQFEAVSNDSNIVDHNKYYSDRIVDIVKRKLDSNAKEKSRIIILQNNQSHLLECPLCLYQERELELKFCS